LPRPPRLVFVALAALEVVVLWKLSELSGSQVADDLPGPSGNVLHVLVYAVLAVLVLRSQVPWQGGWSEPGNWPGLKTRAGVLTLAIVTAAGIQDEVHQYFVPGRTCSAFDVGADMLGALLVLVVPWPSRGGGRPATWRPACLIAALALGLATYGWFERPFADRVLEELVGVITGLDSR